MRGNYVGGNRNFQNGRGGGGQRNFVPNRNNFNRTNQNQQNNRPFFKHNPK